MSTPSRTPLILDTSVLRAVARGDAEIIVQGYDAHLDRGGQWRLECAGASARTGGPSAGHDDLKLAHLPDASLRSEEE